MPDYKVIALKYRPQNFDEVIGQQHITQTLKNAISQMRIAHAYLLVGPRGTGKTTTARIFAKALNCQSSSKPVVSPCGKCDSCREIAAGTSMNVLEIDGASNRGIDEVRVLRESVQYSPAGVRYKVYIIDEVHMLTKEAFNALLKTLEEPPAHVKFIFATTEPQKVLPTILSRCQRFDFHRIAQDLIVKHLESIAKSEKIEVSHDALVAIARGAEGGMRDAESALDQLIAFCEGNIGEENVLSIFGLVSSGQLREMIEALLRGETKVVIEKLGQIAGQGKDLVRLMTELLETLRNLLVFQSGVMLAEESQEEQQWLKKTSNLITTQRLLRIIDILAEAEGQMRYALSKKIFFEIALIKAVQSLSEASLDDVIQRLGALGGGEILSEAPPQQPPSLPAVNTSSSRADPPLEQMWNDLLERVEKVSKMMKMSLSKGRMIALNDQELVIGFDPDFEVEKASIESPKFSTLLHTKVRELLRREINLKIVVADDPGIPQPDKAPISAAAGEVDYKKFEDDPLIKKAMEVFKSRVLEVRK